MKQNVEKDINKDGAIGDKVSDVLTNNSGSKGFYKLASGPYIIDNNGLSIGSNSAEFNYSI